ncbi:methyl-accepting chemotaxis protein [Bacillus solimangrovi]|nr:methyl-accepting chemotaxis protein [Bacillus solimangrovi]
MKLSIRYKLLLSFAVVLLIPSLLIGYIAFHSAKDKISENYVQNASENITFVSHMLDQIAVPKKADVEYFSSLISINDPMSETFTKFEQYHKLREDVQHVYIGTSSGDMYISPDADLEDGYDPRKRPWYQQALEANDTVITEPYVDAVTGEITVTVARPLHDHSGIIAIDFKLDEISKVINDIEIGKEGYAFILSQDQKLISHPTAEVGKEMEGDWASNLFEQDSGAFSYKEGGQSKELVFYTNDTTQWKIAGTLATNEVNSEAQPILIKTVVVIALSIIVGTFIALTIIRSITKPLQTIKEVAGNVTHGDLRETIHISSKDELGKLSVAFNTMIESLRSILFNINGQANSLTSTSEEFTANTEQASHATDQIAANVQEVTAGIENQSNNITEITNIIQQMTADIHQIAESSRHVTETATEATLAANEGTKSVQTSEEQMHYISEKMNDMKNSVQSLGTRSSEIENIIGVITHIAEETNLLALNAAIEASRAGEAGKGFAVVAQEIRKLANQSSASAEQIKHLIKNIQTEVSQAIQHTNEGTTETAKGLEIVSKTSHSFDNIEKLVESAATQIRQVSDASQHLSNGSEQIINSIEEIRSVSEHNSSNIQTVSAATEEQLASMEEIAASADNLSKMAEELQQAVYQFKFDKE